MSTALRLLREAGLIKEIPENGNNGGVEKPHFLISQEEAQARLQNPGSGQSRRKVRSRNLTQEERIAVATEAHFEKAHVVGARHGIATNYVSQLKGKFAQLNEENKAEVSSKTEDIIDGCRNRILTKSTNRLIAAMDGITDSEIEASPLRVKSGVAKDMAIVTEKIAKAGKESGVGPNIQINIYKPELISSADLGPPIEVEVERVS